MSFRYVRVRNSNQETMSQSSLVSVCETNLNDQFKPSFRDNRDRNSQQETTSLPTRWNKTKKQNRDASRVVYETFREDMSYPASARNIPNNIRRAKASWQDDDIDITCHQTHMPIQLRQKGYGGEHPRVQPMRPGMVREKECMVPSMHLHSENSRIYQLVTFLTCTSVFFFWSEFK